MPSTPLDALADDLVAWRARRDPAWATSQCYPGYDALLRNVSADAYREEAAELREFLARLKSTPGPWLDRDALGYALELRLFEVERVRRHERDPDVVMEFLDHLFPLLLRSERPAPERVDSMTARLSGADAFFTAARSRIVVEEVPSLWLTMALESVEAAPAFLDAIAEWGSAASDVPTEARQALVDACGTAGTAIHDFAAWLQNDVAPRAAGEWTLGEDLFEEFLARRHLPHAPDALVDRGETLVEEWRTATEEAARTVLAQADVDPEGRDLVAEAFRIVQRDHPSSFADVLADYREAIASARSFVEKHGLATLPEDAPLDVVETPGYLRHIIPFAAYVEPGKWQREARGTYLVTPKADLSAFARADVRNTTVHEAYPGHHLQLTLARAHPSLTRLFTEATETIEGWGLYSEALMARHGFTSTPAERFVRAKDALWRAVRIVLDVGLHTGRVTFGDAVDRLVRETRMSREEAEAEVKRYTLTPTYNLSYMLGKIELDRLRARAEAAGLSEQAFHDAVLRAGSLPVPLLEKAVFADRQGAPPGGVVPG